MTGSATPNAANPMMPSSQLSPQATQNLNSFMNIAQAPAGAAPAGSLNLPSSFAGFPPAGAGGVPPAGAPPAGAPPAAPPAGNPNMSAMLAAMQGMGSNPGGTTPLFNPGAAAPLPANLTSNYTPPPTGIPTTPPPVAAPAAAATPQQLYAIQNGNYVPITQSGNNYMIPNGGEVSGVQPMSSYTGQVFTQNSSGGYAPLVGPAP